jgi:AraC family transcriptional regulator of arabinose operon
MPEITQNLSRIDRMRRSDPVCFGDVTYGPGGICGPRIQSDFQLVLVLEGSATVEIEEDLIALPEGHGILLRPGHPEKITFDRSQPSRHTWCSVHPAMVQPELSRALGPLGQARRASNSIHRLIECGLHAPARPSVSGLEGMIDYLGLALIAHCLDWEGSRPAEIEPEPVRKTRERIDRHFREPLQLADLARSAGTTGNHLIRLFKKHVGITPTRYLWSVRTREGIELLTRTGLSVSEIADRTGFANPFHFSRMVRQTTGKSPRGFRTEAWSAHPDLHFGETP